MTVEELLDTKKIYFQEKGNDLLVRCFNPEHPDKHPSMRIDKITGVYHCFSCGFKGNVFEFYGEQKNTFQIRRELIKKKIAAKLSDSIGLEMPSDTVLYEGDWRNISANTYKKFNAFQSSSQEFVGRIVFPITDVSGRIVAFIGRHTTLTHTPKYLIYPREARMPLYPRVQPLKGRIILVEGIFDMLNLHDKGLTNAVCCFGTRMLTLDKLKLLRMQGVEGVDVFFDGDEAGRSAAEKAKDLCEKADLFHRNIELKDIDPGSLSEQVVSKLKEKLYE